MALKNVKYVLINENNEPIKNEDGSLEWQPFFGQILYRVKIFILNWC